MNDIYFDNNSLSNQSIKFMFMEHYYVPSIFLSVLPPQQLSDVHANFMTIVPSPLPSFIELGSHGVQ